MPFETIRDRAVVHSERYDEAQALSILRTAQICFGRPSARNRKSKMSKRQRDYRKEYARRAALGEQRGFSRSMARGHPKAGERRRPPSSKTVDPNSREEWALKMIRHGGSLHAAASHFRMSQERLRAYLKETTAAAREKGRWKIVDHRLRQFPFYSEGAVVTPWMNVEQTSEVGRYMQSVKQFLRTGDTRLLARFTGKGARDVNGRFYPFELDENTLYELDHRDEAVIPEQYRISERIAS
jgi:hypothetical protein